MDQDNQVPMVLEDTFLLVIVIVTMGNLSIATRALTNVGITVSMIMVMNILFENEELHFQTNAGMQKI